MSPVADPSVNWTARFPRVSGDEPLGTIKTISSGEFSPRERG